MPHCTYILIKYNCETEHIQNVGATCLCCSMYPGICMLEVKVTSFV